MIKRKCSICGYDKYIGSLQIHHVDGNHDNNEENNLIVLCANCHFEVHSKDVGNRIRNSKCNKLKQDYNDLINLHNITVNQLRKEIEELDRQLTAHVPMR